MSSERTFMTATGLAHVIAAILAVAVGGIALTAPRGSQRHVVAGRTYAGSTLVLTVAL